MSEGAMMSQPASACTIGLAPQYRDGLVVGDIAVADHAVMAVRGERVERHVAQDAELGEACFRALTARHTRLSGLTASCPSGSFSAGSTAGNTAIVGMPSAAPRRRRRPTPDRQAEGVGHRRHRRAPVLVVHEYRPDQVGRRSARSRRRAFATTHRAGCGAAGSSDRAPAAAERTGSRDLSGKRGECAAK